MTVQQRPTAIHPSIDSFCGLQAWLDHRLAGVEEDLAEPETAQSNGRALRERRATLLDVRHAITAAVAAEAAERATVAAEDSIEQQYKAAYGSEPLAPYQAEGR